ncbi:hypothetical protein [Rhodococcus opacus]|uniref:hypothetical protein n=1 Tax=Rhodococcus opacus TaxID=37919 RepID=UPI0002E0E4A5|nr:hypothetical protein [Rhodococcus opacus]
MIAVRLWGREIFAAGRCGCDKDDDATGAADLTGGQFDLADAEPFRDPDADVYLRSRRQRPAVVAIGSRHPVGRPAFGFQPRERSRA